jgi:histidinol-phosphate aminotransferase
MTPQLNPHLTNLKAYVPGEQLNDPEVIKLNTNECPYQPSQAVFEAIQSATGNALRKYPDPTCRPLREAIAGDLGLTPEQILVGNGSDEVLRLIIHAYAPAGQKIAVLDPTYSLYPVLGEMFGAQMEEHPANSNEPLPESFIGSSAPIKFLPNPNPPFGKQYPKFEVESLIENSDLVILDEAYVDFADWNGIPLLSKYKNLLVTRSFSKSHALAGMRVGFCAGPAEIIGKLNAIRDSYNVNHVSQAVALAAWQDKEWLAQTVAQTKHVRGFMTNRLRDMGFDVPDSSGNFVFAWHDLASQMARELKTQKILVRHFNSPALEDGVRISMGTDGQVQRFLNVVQVWLSQNVTQINELLS